MLKTFINALKVKEIRDRFLFTLMCVVVIRIGSLVPTPGIAHDLFKSWLEQVGSSLGFLDALTGGSFSEMSIFALGVSPYINASIIMQLLTIAIPKLEEMQKDGEDGRQKINTISRYVTIALAVIESAAMSISFGNSGYLVGGASFKNIALIVLTLTAGTSFLMWLGERITEKGIGNGISVVLLINIVARLPIDAKVLWQKYVSGASSLIFSIIGFIVILAIIVALVALIVVLQDAERRIPVQYAKKVQGRKMVGGQASSIPLKVNTSGVIPVIFAMSLLQFPIIICSFFGVTGTSEGSFGRKLLYLINQQNWFNFTDEGTGIYTLGVLIYILLIVFFAYFYTAVTFNPVEISNNLKKQSGFIPGIRPGKPTTDFLTDILNKIIFIGAISLSVAAVLPIMIVGLANVSVGFAATSIIIVVGVILETMTQVESMMAVRHYTGFLDK